MGDVDTIADKWLTQRMPRAMEAIGIRTVGAITQTLDTPYPPSSKAGESPHKRTGNLQAGVEHAESVQGDEYVTRITSNRAQGSPDVPIYLELGTSKMAARPYMRPQMNRADQVIPESMQKSLSTGETYAAAG